MSLSTVKKLRHTCIWVMIAFMALGLIVKDSNNTPLLTVALIGMAVPMFALLVLNFFWNCPHCGRHLHRRLYHVEYCPYCGEYLFTE